MNKLATVNESEINSNLPILALNNNMTRIEKLVNRELKKKKYNSIITMDNYAVMKKEGQFLGKVAKQISDFRIAKVKEETQDIKLFEDSLKKFTQMFKDKQETIKSGLDIFEEQTRQKVLLVCKEYFEEFTLKVELRPEFKNINLDDMTLTKYATATFKISKAGIDEVERRVNIQLTLQTKVDNRLLNLENECLRANIEPLTQQHIQGFLYSSDEEYQIKLRNLIVAEIERNEAVKKRAEEQAKIEAEKEIRAKIEQEQKEKLESENKELNSGNPELPNNHKEEDKTVVTETNTTPFDEVLEDGKVRKFVTVTFEVVIPKSWEDKVQSTYEKRFADNIKNVENMKVEVR